MTRIIHQVSILHARTVRSLRTRALVAVAASVTAFSLAACGDGGSQRPPQDTPEVGVQTIAPHPIVASTELSGRLSAMRVADVRPRVQGIVMKRLFTEGSLVAAGAVLYQIDPASYQATDYLTWLSDERLLKITQDTVTADQATYDVTKRIQELGNSSLLDVQQAHNTLASAQASLASYRRAVAQDRNNLVAVLGAPIPDDLPAAPAFDQATDTSMFAEIDAGLPSTLLTRRPDIVEAEHTLRAANANVGVVRAAFFPKIELTVTAGASSSTLSGLFKAGTGAWTFAPTVSLPIFDYGSNKASLDVAKIEKNIEIADCENAIQTAFKEVSNALMARATYIDQVSADHVNGYFVG